jgi:hypothetical protein
MMDAVPVSIIFSLSIWAYTDGLAGTVQNGTWKNKFHIPFIFSFNLFFSYSVMGDDDDR